MDIELMRRAPPSSTEAELSVIGALLQDAKTAIYVFESLEPDDFYTPQHREIYLAMQALNAKASPIDIMTTTNELTSRGTLDGIGGAAYLLSAYRFVPTTANTKSYVKIVREKSTLRKMIATCQAIQEKCMSGMEDADSISRTAEREIASVALRKTSSEPLEPISTVLVAAFDKIEEMGKLKGRLSGIPTGLHDIDRMLTGIHAGELLIVGARPAMGKTSLLLGIADYAALKARKRVAIFSMEMPKEQIAMRMVCGWAEIDMQHIRNGTMCDEEWVKLGDCINEFSKTNIYIDDTPGITPTQMRGRIRKRMLDGGIDLVLVDYLGLMDSDTKTNNTNQKISDISRGLKAIALELKIPVVACAQLARANTMRTDKRPMLNDLRDSGSIEQDADVVLFIHREGYYKTDREEGKDDTSGEIIIAKQRNGPVGTAEVEWVSKFAKYRNLPGTIIPQQY